MITSLPLFAQNTEGSQTGTVQMGDSVWTIQLGNVIVTPNNEDPGTYILNLVNKRAKKNAKTLRFNATVRQHLGMQDMDFLDEVLPWRYRFLIGTALRLGGYYSLWKFCMEQPRVEANTSVDVIFDRGDEKFVNKKVLNSYPEMNAKVTKSLLNLVENSPYDMLYGKHRLWSKKNLKEYHYEFLGTLEEDGHVIDVLRGKKGKFQVTIFVVEDLWGILRVEYNTPIGYTRVEAKNFNGVYLPVQRIDRPNVIGVTSDSLQYYVNKYIEQKGKKLSRTERKMSERMEKVLESRGGKINPSVSYHYDVTYH